MLRLSSVSVAAGAAAVAGGLALSALPTGAVRLRMDGPVENNDAHLPHDDEGVPGQAVTNQGGRSQTRGGSPRHLEGTHGATTVSDEWLSTQINELDVGG